MVKKPAAPKSPQTLKHANDRNLTLTLEGKLDDTSLLLREVATEARRILRSASRANSLSAALIEIRRADRFLRVNFGLADDDPLTA